MKCLRSFGIEREIHLRLTQRNMVTLPAYINLLYNIQRKKLYKLLFARTTKTGFLLILFLRNMRSEICLIEKKKIWAYLSSFWGPDLFYKKKIKKLKDIECLYKFALHGQNHRKLFRHKFSPVWERVRSRKVSNKRFQYHKEWYDLWTGKGRMKGKKLSVFAFVVKRDDLRLKHIHSLKVFISKDFHSRKRSKKILLKSWVAKGKFC